MDPLNAFMAKSVPPYAELFKAEHSEKQALVLFEKYLCHRALLDVLSLRVSRWENLVKLLYHQVKEDLDEECMEWLCLVHLAVSVRDAILFPNQTTFSDVLKCIKVNGALFPSLEVHRNFNDNLNSSIASYFVLTEDDKNKAREMCHMDQRVLEAMLAFPYVSPEQRSVLVSKKTLNSVLVDILHHLKLKMMEMEPPSLTGMLKNGDGFVQNGETDAIHLTDEREAFSESEMQCEYSNTAAAATSTTTTFVTAASTVTSAITIATATANGDSSIENERIPRLSNVVPQKYVLRGTNDDEGEPLEILPEEQPMKNAADYSSDDPVSSSKDDISISEDNEPLPLALPSKLRSVRHQWTNLEVKKLLAGVKKFGVGSWSKIHKNYKFLPCRDQISLKDKWRNMVKNKEVPKRYL